MTNIKAIDTEYQGYLFRSRLEARWAVFFDAVGIKWEYEPKGFELPSGRYLPDFYLPEHSSHIEIKRENAFEVRGIRKARGVYMAGKVGLPAESSEYMQRLSGWRDDISGRCGDYYYHKERLGDPWRDNDGGVDVGVDYIGPHFGEDHGMYQGGDDDQGHPFNRALAEIRAADFVFSWISSLDCYGTIAEIGYAAALGKPIYIGHNSLLDVSELWFVFRFGTRVGAFARPLDAWNGLVPASVPLVVDPQERKVMELSETTPYPTLLCMGDPLETDIYTYRGGTTDGRVSHKNHWGVLPVRWDEAAKGARQYRFAGGRA